MIQHEIWQALQAGEALVYGHRGAKAYAPMNTLAAFELAAEQGAHGIELDVHRSADGYPVILHDFTVDHTTNSTGDIRQMTLAHIKSLDAGSWFSPQFAGAQIPTLDEVFESVGRRLFINVEIKSESLETDGVEQVVADCIRRHAMGGRVIVSSFNPHALRRFHALMPTVPLGYLTFPAYLPELGVLDDLAYHAYHPHHESITPELVAQHAEQGHILNTWTVNDPVRAVTLRDLGVRGIITDNPDTVLAALRA